MFELNNIDVNQTGFIYAAKKIGLIFKEEGIDIAFTGYKDVLLKYSKCTDYDIIELQELTKEMNLWSTYLGDMSALAFYQLTVFENKLNYLEAFPLTKITDEKKINMKNKIALCKMFYKQLNIQLKLFYSCYAHCRNLYEKAIESYIFRY